MSHGNQASFELQELAAKCQTRLIIESRCQGVGPRHPTRKSGPKTLLGGFASASHAPIERSARNSSPEPSTTALPYVERAPTPARRGAHRGSRQRSNFALG